ncbi:MAG: polysaccharide biosynthesis C-terminal domain-containing protein, partial [Clostridiales bacterium]|nr:polysaccharide biosynthesis C-terminal domain-containing protein [Clostridiales bacterium]
MKQNKLTEGSVARGIIFFALPLLGCSLIQQLYTTVDLIFVSRLLGTQAAAAVGASDLLVTCLVGFFSGMAVGTSVYTAQYFGSRRWEELHRLIQTIFVVGIAGGLILTAAGELFAPLFLRLMGTPATIVGQAVIYLRIYMLGMISIVSYNLLSGVIRALGDSRSPMIFQTTGGIINIAADYICIAVLKMGGEGTAIATCLSQTVAAALAMCYLSRMKQPYALKIFTPAFDARQLNKVFRVGVPAGLQSIVITLSNIIIQSKINTLGVASFAAFAVYFTSERIV